MEATLSPLVLASVIYGLTLTVVGWHVQSRKFVRRAERLLLAVRKQLHPREAEWISFLLSGFVAYVIHSEPVGIVFVGFFSLLACSLMLYSVAYESYLMFRRADRSHR